jgi:uncharacterized protein YbjT (DUF2867 family)
MPSRTLLLTGASGFVGRYVWSLLVNQGWSVRCLTRDTARAQRLYGDRDWVQGDLSDNAVCTRALQGCQAALYMVHSIGKGDDFGRHEVDTARRFAENAAKAGLQRVVYLGGVAPAGNPSDHLASRLAVGEALRAGDVPTIELRASMIIGHGSLSWLMVRDLAARLPVMVLPSWLRSRTQPVAIADVAMALCRSFDVPLSQNAWFDLPGPNVMSAHEILDATAFALQLPKPLAIEVPFLSSRLSAHWLRFVTRADWTVAKELVSGLTSDLLARDDSYWRLIDHSSLQTFEEAARAALQAERDEGAMGGAWGYFERLRTKASNQRGSF